MKKENVFSLFSEFVLGREYSFSSNMEFKTFTQKLKAKTGNFNWVGDNESQPFVGKITDLKFCIRRRQLIRKAFTPFFSGEIIDKNGRAFLKGKIHIHSFILFLLLFWFSIFFIVAGFFIYYSGLDELADWFMLFPLLFIFTILLMMSLMVRSEIDKLEEELNRLLIFES